MDLFAAAGATGNPAIRRGKARIKNDFVSNPVRKCSSYDFVA